MINLNPDQIHDLAQMRHILNLLKTVQSNMEDISLPTVDPGIVAIVKDNTKYSIDLVQTAIKLYEDNDERNK